MLTYLVKLSNFNNNELKSIDLKGYKRNRKPTNINVNIFNT